MVTTTQVRMDSQGRVLIPKNVRESEKLIPNGWVEITVQSVVTENIQNELEVVPA